jgi:hypothetical protein
MAASLLNPNGIDNFVVLLQMSGQKVLWSVQEFRSTFAAFADERMVLLIWALFLLHLAALFGAARAVKLADWLVSLFVVAMAAAYMRNVPFAVVSLIPMTGWYLERALSGAGERWQRGWQKGALLLAGIFLLYLGSLLQTVVAARRQGAWGELSSELPPAITAFLKSVPATGNILCDYNWGGYLIWELFPQYRTVLDGRVIDPQILEDYFKIGEASLTPVAGRPEYEVLIDRYAIDIFVMDTEVESTGVNVLMKHLLNRPEWHPVFLGGQGCVLMKKHPGTEAVLREYQIDKLVFLQRLVAMYDQYIRRHPGDYRRYFGRGELLGYLGHYDDAARDFATVRQLDPDNPYLPAKLRQLEKLREQAKAKP